MHLAWNTWWQGSVRSTSPSSYSHRHTAPPSLTHVKPRQVRCKGRCLRHAHFRSLQARVVQAVRGVWGVHQPVHSFQASPSASCPSTAAPSSPLRVQPSRRDTNVPGVHPASPLQQWSWWQSMVTSCQPLHTMVHKGDRHAEHLGAGRPAPVTTRPAGQRLCQPLPGAHLSASCRGMPGWEAAARAAPAAFVNSCVGKASSRAASMPRSLTGRGPSCSIMPRSCLHMQWTAGDHLGCMPTDAMPW